MASVPEVVLVDGVTALSDSSNKVHVRLSRQLAELQRRQLGGRGTRGDLDGDGGLAFHAVAGVRLRSQRLAFGDAQIVHVLLHGGQVVLGSAGDIAVPNEGEFNNPNETMLTSLSDGRVMLVTRNVSKPNRKLITTSPNGATNWSRPKFHDQLWEPICMASIIAHPSQPGTLIFSNPHTRSLDESGKEKPAGRGKRRNLSIKLSRDDGKTWPINKTLNGGKSAYSDLAVLPDGTVLCLYERIDSITCARFDLDWVTAP